MIPELVLQKWRNWPYKNTFFLVFSLVVFFYLAKTGFVQQGITAIGQFGFFGAFLAGAMFVSIFTVAPAALILFELAKYLDPYVLAAIAGAGAVLGDYIIFRFLRDRVFEELAPVFQKIPGSFLKKLFRTPLFIWAIPLLGAVIIASPLPDELGISLMGLSKVKNWQFILISFALNAIGIFVVITLAQTL